MTFIGRIERGFDFLGYTFSPAGLAVAETSAAKFVARAFRLYEQGPGEACASTRLGSYVRRWGTWVSAGLRLAIAETGTQRQRFAERQPTEILVGWVWPS